MAPFAGRRVIGRRMDETRSARDLVAGLADGRWSSRELTEAFLARIAARNPGIHALCLVEADPARRAADAADARRRVGAPRGPLDGLPMSFKDGMRVAGSRSSWGLRLYARHRPRSSSRVVAVLEAAGVVRLGRSAVPTGCFDWNCRNGVYAECLNPLDPSRTPGGSSGGAAAALAAGLTPLELGSDLGGSIRYPCHCCGVYGMRTTDGWIPVDDAGPEGSPVGYEHLVVFGPMARHPGDLDLLLAAWDAAFPLPPAPEAPAGIALSFGLGGLEADRGTRAALERWAGRLGLPVVEACPEIDFDQAFVDWGLIGGFEFARCLPGPLRLRAGRWAWGRVSVQGRLGPGVFTERFRAGLSASAADYEGALARRAEVHRALEAFFRRHGAWALPVSPAPALPLAAAGRAVPWAGAAVPYASFLGGFTAPTALLGTPALTGPVGRVDGLPVAVQLHGPRFSDRVLARRAEALLPPLEA